MAGCRCYQNSKCRSRLTTRNAEILGNSDPQHNHSGSKDISLAHQAVAEMKDEMDEVSATTTAAIGSVGTQFQSDVFNGITKESLSRRM